MNTEENTNSDLSVLEDLIKPEIYSKRVIYSFSILFSNVFGGILLMQNLKSIGKKKEATLVLIVSICLTALTILLLTVFQINNSTVTLAINIGGAALLSEYFFKKYFPNEEDYPKKKVWKPLVIGIVLVAVLVFLYFLGQRQTV